MPAFGHFARTTIIKMSKWIRESLRMELMMSSTFFQILGSVREAVGDDAAHVIW